MIQALEGLRGVAAIAVALFHGWPSFVTQPFSTSWLAVDLFFVISGFVMSHVYRAHLSTGPEVAAFALKRFGRLYPLHLVTLFAFIACEMTLQLAKPLASLLGRATNPANFDLIDGWSLVSNLLLLHGIGAPGERAYNAPSWSISTEIWVYAVFASTAFMLRGRMLVIAWSSLGVGGLLLWVSAGQSNHITDGTYFLRCLYGFFLGALLPLVKIPRAGWFQVASMVCTLALFASVGRLPELKFAGAIVFSALVLSISGDAGPVATFLRMPALQWLGRLSYSVYMTHTLVLVFFNPLGQALAEPYSSLLIIAYIASVLGISALTYRWIEDPWRRRFAAISPSTAPLHQSSRA